MDFEQALTADELWGWPVEVLDQLWQLRSRAQHGELSLEQWREQDAALRPGHPRVDVEEVSEFRLSCLMDLPADVPRDARDRLLHRMMVLTVPAPTDEDLWQELAEIVESMSDPDFRRADLQRKLGARRDTVRSWLARPGSGVDMLSGLPWATIARYRVVEDPVLGPVPQYVDSARKMALSEASEDERRRAALFVDDRDRRMDEAMADFNRAGLLGLVDLLKDAAVGDDELKPAFAKQVDIWRDPLVQGLLMRETSHGWQLSDEDLEP
ncbi:hypothetical protein [Amycolatopsis sp. NPDC004378]